MNKIANTVILCLGTLVFLQACISSNEAPKEKELVEKTSIEYKGKVFLKENDTCYIRVNEDTTFSTLLTTYVNGEVKSIEHQGDFNSCGALVDTSFFYNRSGNLTKTIYHDHWMPLGAISCEESMCDLFVTHYYGDGVVQSKKLYRRAYQGERKNFGVWEDFDEKGNLLSAKEYGDPFEVIRVLNSSFLESMEAMMNSSSLTRSYAKMGFVLSETLPDKLIFKNINNIQKLQMKGWNNEESFFQAEYHMDSMSLLTFVNGIDSLKYEREETKRFHPKAPSYSFIKKGLGSHETKEIQVYLYENKIVYTHWVGKVLSEMPVEMIQQNNDH